MPDWVSLKADYVSGGGSFKALAEKYGVSVSAIKRRSSADGGWEANRNKAEPKLYQKTVRKVIEEKAGQKADRLTRLLGVGDLLADKLDLASRQLGAYAVVKRKGEHVITEGDGTTRLVEDTEEILVSGESAINTADAKRIASALKDLHDIAKAPDPENDASLTKARELLGGIPSAID